VFLVVFLVVEETLMRRRRWEEHNPKIDETVEGKNFQASLKVFKFGKLIGLCFSLP
jgi:hypothetical protein